MKMLDKIGYFLLGMEATFIIGVVIRLLKNGI